MAALSERKMAIVRTLVESAPDRVVGSLSQALAATSEASALGGVRRLVETEVCDRTLRNSVLQPVVPLCWGGGDDAKILNFPSRALSRLWKGLREVKAEAVEAVRNGADGGAAVYIMLGAYDDLTAAAAAGLRARDTDDFRAAAELCDLGRAGGAETLARCLDIAPVVRTGAQRLAEWIAHPGGHTSASVRVAYKDAVAIADDAGPRFFHMLAAQMAQPWMVLRVISAVMEKPTERYLAESEFASFAENLMAEIDEGLDRISTLRAEDGPTSGRQAAKSAELIVQQIAELETCIAMDRAHGWGKRVVAQRARLANVAESRLREAEKAVIEALPMQTSRHHRARRPAPRLSSPPDARCIDCALTLLSFSEELRTTANYGGFSATRAKLVEKAGEYLDTYVEEVLDLVRTESAESREHAPAFLEAASEFNRLIRGEKASELVRRRAHAAFNPEPAT